MPEISQARPKVDRVRRSSASFSRRKRLSWRCVSPRVPGSSVFGLVGCVLGHAVPFRVVTQTGRNWLVEGGRRRLGCKPSEHGLEGLGLMAVPLGTQALASAVVAVDRRDVHQVQDDRAQANPLRLLRAVLRFDLPRRLADPPADVESERRKGEDERVRPVVAARQPLDVHVRLGLSVELLARVVVEPDDRVRVFGKVRPPRCRHVSREELVVALHALHLPGAERRTFAGRLRARKRGRRGSCRRRIGGRV